VRGGGQASRGGLLWKERKNERKTYARLQACVQGALNQSMTTAGLIWNYSCRMTPAGELVRVSW
jgi:hypothetical protein